MLPRPEIDCIFPAVLRKPSEAVVETQARWPGKRPLRLVRHAYPGGLKARRPRARLGGSRNLLRERTSRLVEDDTRNGFEQTPLILAHLVRKEQVHAAAAAQEPNDAYWYAFGRIAEQYGEREIAIADYRKLEKPKQLLAISTSTWRLAQMRLKAMNVEEAAPAK